MHRRVVLLLLGGLFSVHQVALLLPDLGQTRLAVELVFVFVDAIGEGHLIVEIGFFALALAIHLVVIKIETTISIVLFVCRDQYLAKACY